MWRRASLIYPAKTVRVRLRFCSSEVVGSNISAERGGMEDSLDDKMFPQLVRKVLQPLSKISEESIFKISHLLVREKCTVPFLVRYKQSEMIPSSRRGETSDIAAPIIFELQQELEKWGALVKLRKTRVATLEKSDVPVDSVVIDRMENCLTRAELDEVYESVKPAAKKTKVEAAKCVEGLESVAKYLLNERPNEADGQSFTKLDTGAVSELLRKHQLRKDDSDFCAHLQNYLADFVAHSEHSVIFAKRMMLPNVRVTVTESKAKDGDSKAKSRLGTKETTTKGNVKVENLQLSSRNTATEQQKYRDYFNFDRLLRSASSHQVLALRRGKDVGALKLSLKVEERAISSLQRHLEYHYQINTKSDFHPSGILQWRNSLMSNVVVTAVKKILVPMVTRLAWKNALTLADEEALDFFANNLRHMLLTPPLVQYLNRETSDTSFPDSIAVCGIDPGYAHGNKLVVLEFSLKIASARPKILSCMKLFTTSQNSIEKLAELIDKYSIQVVAIGNGTGSREAQKMTVESVRHVRCSGTGAKGCDCRIAVVSEVGASVYSVSSLADKEYPDLEVTFRGAVSIARRLIDPLQEMVKVPPEALGIGMYQHDLKEAILGRRLSEVLEEIVSDCGVDLNLASEETLCYVSGLQRSKAKAITTFRDQNGRFKSREDLKLVKGIGDFTYRNCAGFLRVYPPPGETSYQNHGYDPLDSTNVHPDMYTAARVILRFAWQELHKGKKKCSNDSSHYRLLFSNDLQRFFSGLSEAEWKLLASKCSKSLGLGGRTTHDESFSEHEVRQLGSWLADEEFCGDNYHEDMTNFASNKRGIRAKRGHPPALLNVNDVNFGQGVSKLLKRSSDDISDSQVSNDEIVPKRRKRSECMFDSLEVGQERVGTVRNITSFGVFLDIGSSRDGLLHVSEYRFHDKSRRNSSNKLLDESLLVLGATIKVRIKSLDAARNRISLSLVT